MSDNLGNQQTLALTELTLECANLRQQLTAEREARKKAEQQRDSWALLAKQNEQLASEAIQRAESAEQRNREAMEQEPCSWEVYSEQGVVYSASYKEACHEHINDAINDFQLVEASRWRVRPVYAAPITPADVAGLKRENEQYAKDVLQLIKQLRYCIGIAERGTGRAQREDEVGELFLLEYVKGLERKLAEHQSHNNFDATRLRRLTAFCGVAAPDSDEELLQVAGVVIGSCLRNLTKLLEEAKRQAVPDGMVLVREDVRDFLLGASPFLGAWFGEPLPDNLGKYWWRQYLTPDNSAAPQPDAAIRAKGN